MDLTFSKLSLEALHEKISIALPFDVNPTRVGGSAALRLAVPRVNHLLPFDDQQEEVLSVLAAVERLLAIGRGVISQQDETWRRFVWLDGDVEIAPAKPDTDHD